LKTLVQVKKSTFLSSLFAFTSHLQTVFTEGLQTFRFFSIIFVAGNLTGSEALPQKLKFPNG